jgi:protein-L-isoaspartate O-methyltransferase
LQDTQRQLICVKAGFATMDERLVQQLNVSGRVSLEKGREQGVELAP